MPETPQPLDHTHDFHTLHHERAITVTPVSLRLTDGTAASRLGDNLSREALTQA